MLYKKLAYDPDRELQVIAIVTDLPSSWSFIPRFRRRPIAEFVAHAKQNPGKINSLGRHRWRRAPFGRDAELMRSR